MNIISIMKKIYKPAKTYLIIDLSILVLTFYTVLDWFPLSTNTPFEKYSWPSLAYFIVWFLCSYAFGRYKPIKRQQYFVATLRLLDACLILLLLFKILIEFVFPKYSSYVLITITAGAFILNYIALSIYFAYRYAVEYNEITIAPKEERENAQVKPALPLDNKSYNQLCNSIKMHSGIKLLEFLKTQIDLKSGNTLVYTSTDTLNLQMFPNYQYSSIVQLNRLNDMRGINKTLNIVNEKLPDDGIFVCCFESKSTYKKLVLKRHLKYLNYVIYSFDYLFKRVLPKIIFTRKLFYFFTGGKNRVFSKAEVIGRLYCFGFEVINEKKINNCSYVFARRHKQPEFTQKRIYGPLIRLRRFGKNGKAFDVFKMRTMHPYSEYLQAYIYERNSLRDGGKFNKDTRVTTVGTFMRKYWFDELPMIINLLKGDMKLVGVRPLSPHYFSLYSKELQELRIKFRPGLLPPFYADMPHTLTEIEASEMRYLRACEKKGVFLTDLHYFFIILNNIIFKKARSA